MSEGPACLDWNCEMEVNLFHSLRGHKPVGVNRHFHIISIHEKMSGIYKNITTTQIWNFLGELWDLNALNESEITPFPNKETEFILPENDFNELMNKKVPGVVLPILKDKPEDVSEETEQQKEEKIERHKDDKTGKHKDDKSERHKDDKKEKATDEKNEKQKNEKSQKHKALKDKSESAKPTKSALSTVRYSLGNASDESSKRKRTRQTPSTASSPATPSAAASPATPEVPPSKRRK